MRGSNAVISVALLVFSTPCHATTVRLTMYDDGLSCPANCDAHVVYHPSLDATEFAHAPSTPHAPYSRCSSGSECEVCFEDGHKQCLTVMYRGAGPTRNTFDFTPAFYEEVCSGQ